MAKKTKKQAFTIVELVIVIAVIAILAAILIPTYSNLVKKANEATALADAKNLITEMLADILSGDKDAADLIVFSKKGDAVYAHGYSAEAGRIISYSKNPEELNGAAFADKVKGMLTQMEADGAITRITTSGENDWRTADNTAQTVKDLGFNPDEMIVRADYKIALDKFEKHTHTFGAWVYDGANHWHECTVCHEKADVAEHTYGADNKCVCGAVDPGAGHTHTYNKENTADTYLVSKATCTEAAKYYYSCECGEKGTKTFTSGSALGHSYAETTKTPATCIATGLRTLKCTRCNDEKTETIALVPHSYGTEWEKDETNHWHECTVTECHAKTDVAAHTYVNGICECGQRKTTECADDAHDWVTTTIAPTCQEGGKIKKTCTKCSKTTEDVDTDYPTAVPYMHKLVLNGTYSKQTRGGDEHERVFHLGSCKYCLEVFDAAYAEATYNDYNGESCSDEHKWMYKEMTSHDLDPATVNKDELEVIFCNGTCKVCGKRPYRTQYHDYDETTHKCKVCGTYDCNVCDAETNGKHYFGDLVITKPATCTEGEKQSPICTKCLYPDMDKEKTVGEPLRHKKPESKDGYIINGTESGRDYWTNHYYICSRCEEICTEKHTSGDSCSICGKVACTHEEYTVDKWSCKDSTSGAKIICATCKQTYKVGVFVNPTHHVNDGATTCKPTINGNTIDFTQHKYVSGNCTECGANVRNADEWHILVPITVKETLEGSLPYGYKCLVCNMVVFSNTDDWDYITNMIYRDYSTKDLDKITDITAGNHGKGITYNGKSYTLYYAHSNESGTSVNDFGEFYAILIPQG